MRYALVVKPCFGETGANAYSHDVRVWPSPRGTEEALKFFDSDEEIVRGAADSDVGGPATPLNVPVMLEAKPAPVTWIVVPPTVEILAASRRGPPPVRPRH